MQNLDLILYIASFVLFVLATINVPSGRFNLIAAGLACFAASLIFS